jgi:hypothetical protein
MANKERTVKTDYGLVVKVRLEKGHTIVLEAEDGNLTMPDAVFEIQEQGGAKHGANPYI